MLRILSRLSVMPLVMAATIAGAQPPQRPQTQEDDYTRYELLAPGTAQFRILYEVTATKSGAPFFFNAIRKGSVATDEHVYDAASGEPLKWEVVNGAQARADGHPRADLETEWIKVYLKRPVPDEGEARVVIDKTYKDEKSYFRDGDAIVFDRSLGIRRNAVVLPAGYRLVSCNVPAQVMATADGRVMITFLNTSAAAAPLVLRATPGLPAFTPALADAPGRPVTVPSPSPAARLSDRAHQDREATFLLDDPATHRYTMQHDYTESEPGHDRYRSIAEPGTRVTAATARNLDTGEPLVAEITSGAEASATGAVPPQPRASASQAVLVTFPRIPANGSTRMRIAETQVDETGYALDGDELVWDRVLDRARNIVVLPAGWTVVASSMPTTVSAGADGRQRLSLENSRPDTMQVMIRARRVKP